MIKTDELKDFLTAFSGSIENEQLELYKKIIENSEMKSFNGANEFFYAVLYPWEKFISGFLKTKLKASDEVVFIYKNSQYIDRNFAELFRKFEGLACSADKSRTIVKAILNFYTTGEKIDFDYEGEYTYHLPETIFKNHDDIILFYRGLRNLMSGNSLVYLESLKKLIDNNKA